MRRGIAGAWLGTWRHVDSRTSTVVQVRGVSTTEEREGLRTTALGCPGEPCGLWLYRGEFCVIKEQTTSQI